MLFPSVFKLVNKLKFTFLNAVFFSCTRVHWTQSSNSFITFFQVVCLIKLSLNVFLFCWKWDWSELCSWHVLWAGLDWRTKKSFFLVFLNFFFKEYLTCVIKSGHVGGRLTAASARWLLFSVLVQGEYKNPLFRMNSDWPNTRGELWHLEKKLSTLF